MTDDVAAEAVPQSPEATFGKWENLNLNLNSTICVCCLMEWFVGAQKKAG